MNRTKGVRRWPEWLRRLVAKATGYFWLPCPVCGRLFAGYEWDVEGGITIWLTPHQGTGVCSPACVEDWNRNHQLRVP